LEYSGLTYKKIKYYPYIVTHYPYDLEYGGSTFKTIRNFPFIVLLSLWFWNIWYKICTTL